MSRLREPRIAGPVPVRALGPDRILVAGPTGRAALLTEAEHAAFAPAVDLESLARERVESGELNWAGPATHVILASARGAAMSPETAKIVVDFVFATPRPGVTLEIVDEDGDGWPAARFIMEYARRRAQWAGRGLALWLRAAARPSRERAELLRCQGAGVRAALRVEGAPGPVRLFGARRARLVLGRGACEPEAWVDALAGLGVSGVEWVASAELTRDAIGARRFADFTARAFARMSDGPQAWDLRDELAAALLSARPWEVPGVDLLETLAYAPDGSVYTSEEGRALDVDRGDSTFLLGHAGSLRFQDLPALPQVPALTLALAREAQPLCAACVYAPYCVVAPSAHVRAQGTLHGRLPDSPRCMAHMALLDAFFSRLPSEKCLKMLEKWGIDTWRYT